MSDNVCGHEKNDGEPCTFSPRYPDGKCGHHTQHDSANTGDSGRKHKLDENPEIVDLMAEEVERGATIGEALTEVYEKTGVFIAQSTHGNWMAHGRKEDAKEIEKEYRSEVKRARERAKREGRQDIQRKAAEKGDTRTMLEIHKMQYGDLYADEGEDIEREPPFDVPEELIEKWRQEA
jgi:hypothetical protein